MKTQLVFWALILIFGYTSLAQTETLKKEISTTLEYYANSLNGKDVEKAASTFIDDQYFKYISKGFIVNKTEWKLYQLESWQRMSHFNFKWSQIDIKMLGKKSAVATCTASKSFRLSGGVVRSVNGRYTISFEKHGDGWMINGIHESSYVK